jgi:hypothetical protein
MGPDYDMRRLDSVSRSCEKFAWDTRCKPCSPGVWVSSHGPGNHVGEEGTSQSHWGSHWVHLRGDRQGGRLGKARLVADGPKMG